jgi:hypothetical protein
MQSANNTPTAIPCFIMRLSPGVVMKVQWIILDAIAEASIKSVNQKEIYK